MRRSEVRWLIAVLALLAAGCAPKLTTQQALVEEAFRSCQPQGPSTKLERVERDGKFSVVGKEGEAQRVHDCMVRFDQTERLGARAAAPAPATLAPAPKAPPLQASRLPGTWRGTLTLPPRSTGDSEVASPATVRFTVVGGTLRWTLATGATASAVAADGSAMVIDGELRMTGTVRPGSSRPPADAKPVSVRYAGTMVGERLEVTGVTADKQVHLLSVRRVE
ncbi:MAG TPA: hypothetical protein VFV05_15225 [Methylomirabilota bacterium]|nr:hypothetical protein [Methylomirabilota bacterium]